MFRKSGICIAAGVLMTMSGLGAGESPSPACGSWDCRSQTDGKKPVWGSLWVEAEKGEKDRWVRHLPDGRSETLGRDEEGRLVVLACADPEHDAWTVYQPPIPLFSTALEEGQEWRGKGQVKVYELKDRKTLSRSGDYEIRWMRMNDDTVRQDDRSIPCRRFRSRLDLNLGMIQVATESVECYDGRGVLVAAQSSEKVQAWVTLWSRKQTLLARLPREEGRSDVALGFTGK